MIQLLIYIIKQIYKRNLILKFSNFNVYIQILNGLEWTMRIIGSKITSIRLTKLFSKFD